MSLDEEYRDYFIRNLHDALSGNYFLFVKKIQVRGYIFFIIEKVFFLNSQTQKLLRGRFFNNLELFFRKIKLLEENYKMGFALYSKLKKNNI